MEGTDVNGIVTMNMRWYKKKKLMGDIITSYYRNMETKTNLFDKYGLFVGLFFSLGPLRDIVGL